MPRRILLIVIVGLVARILMLALFAPLHNIYGGDAAMFVAQAPWRPGWEPPGYPLFLWAVGTTPAAVIIAQMVLTIGAALFTYVRTRLLWLALAISACPFLIIYELRIYTEALVCVLVWVALLLLGWPRRRWEPVAAGILLGFASLTRDTLYLMPVVPVLLAIRTKELRPAMLACAVAFLTVLPWQIAGGSPKISHGRAGFALWVGTWERNPDWMLGGLTNWPPYANGTPELRTALARHDEGPFTQAALRNMREAPFKVLETWALRYPRLWIGTRTDAVDMRLERHSPAWTVSKLGFFGLNALLLLFGFWGMWRARHDPQARIVAAPIIYLGTILIPFHNAEPRYTLPAVPPLLFFAGLSVAHLQDRTDVNVARCG